MSIVTLSARNYKNRSKYTLLVESSSSKGSGFLFNIRKPSLMMETLPSSSMSVPRKKETTIPPLRKTKTVKPSTLVIPSNKKLLRALLQTLAELREGNTSMRNLVMPLAQEAKRKGIKLPKNLFSPNELTWVYA